ncbi:hypothetical protein GMPD_15600 [Geomonas paludis]|uniref:Uncharacterized protein n=1 Tax=Geomonas paludis TaxID=2740185 RepID=A0A6V8MUF2_9BACT|nr:hypothetical protein GMPD_15600 [Geomonas paludis]
MLHKEKRSAIRNGILMLSSGKRPHSLGALFEMAAMLEHSNKFNITRRTDVAGLAAG